VCSSLNLLLNLLLFREGPSLRFPHLLRYKVAEMPVDVSLLQAPSMAQVSGVGGEGLFLITISDSLSEGGKQKIVNGLSVPNANAHSRHRAYAGKILLATTGSRTRRSECDMANRTASLPFI
jgi:hypothetical protein